MNKDVSKNLIYVVLFSIIWSVVFVNTLHSVAGIGIGLCFGVATGNSFNLVSKKGDDSKKK